MADAARLVIEIEDRPGSAPAPPGGSTYPAPGGAGGWGGGGSGGGGGGHGGGSPGDDPYRERIGWAERGLRGTGPAGRSYELLAKSALAAGGRPADASDEEWLWYSRESGKRGQEAGRIALQAAAHRRKQEEALQKQIDAAKEAERKEEERIQKEDAARLERDRLAKEQRTATYAGAAMQASFGVAQGETGAGKRAGATIGATAGSLVGTAIGGPIGAAVGQVVGQELGEKVGAHLDDPFLETTRALTALNTAVQHAGQSFVQIAGNDGVGLFVSSAAAAADQLERIPAVGKVLAAEFRLISGSVGAATAVLDAFAARGRELAGYNGPLAGSVARQDVARLLADVREANQLGEKLSRVVDAQTKLELFLREALGPLKEAIADRIPAAVDNGIEVARVTAKIWETFVPPFQMAFGKVSDDIERMRKKAEAGTGDAELRELWFGGLAGLAGPGPAPFAMDTGAAAPAPVAAPFGPPR